MALELPVFVILLLLEQGDEWKDWLEPDSGEVGENCNALGPHDWRSRVQASLGVLQVELVQLGRQLLILIQEEARKEVRDGVAVAA